MSWMHRKRRAAGSEELISEELEDDYRSLADNLLGLGAGRELRTLAVSSTVHGEGSSSVACNLAAAFARDAAGDVLLVDSNFRRPSLAERFGFEGKPGLTEAIHDEVEVREFIMPTRLPKLFVLTAGTVHANSTELLASERFKHLLEDTTNRFSLVIFDTAPIAPYRDTAALSALVDGLLLVVEAERVLYEVIERARDKVTRAGGSIVGTVLNRRRYHIPEALYWRL